MGESENAFEDKLQTFMVDERVAERVKELVEGAFEQFLKDELVVLTRSEQDRIYQTVVGEMFDEILGRR